MTNIFSGLNNTSKSESQTAVNIDTQYGWKTTRKGQLQIHAIGRQESIEKVTRHFDKEGVPDLKRLANIFEELEGCYGLVVENKNWVLAVVDKIRGYPLFYSEQETGMFFSNSARLILGSNKNSFLDNTSLIELQMAGYVSGANTLYNNVKQIQAGEFIFWDKRLAEKIKINYFSFYVPETLKTSHKSQIEELAEITDTIFKRTVADIGSKKVWVPLSGGLDSRLVLCKLKEHGCENLHAFSYGVPNNYEASVAKHVAKVLDVPWVFVPDSMKMSRDFFYSKTRKNYWEFADELQVIPNLHQICSLIKLIESDKIKPGDVLINGQSGDFIAGQHIPEFSGKYNENILIKKIIAKHYKHRQDLLIPENIICMQEKILDIVHEHTNSTILDEQEFAKQYELWEWRERQAKRVVNGQRNYDFLGLGWELPLWDCEYLNFWRMVPVTQKKKRSLFVDYVEHNNFYGLFKDYKPLLSRWPGNRILIQFLGNGLKLLLGSNISRFYYEHLDYFSHYSYLYAQLTYPQYFQLCGNYKSPIAFYTMQWMKENLDYSFVRNSSFEKMMLNEVT
jgi:asparagine synthase (glutamine-hydrolysing)